MKKIIIYYHMIKDDEIAETCITLPMADEMAADILADQADSEHVKFQTDRLNVYDVIYPLARIQGYSQIRFVLAAGIYKEEKHEH
jgi:hypothetical protein